MIISPPIRDDKSESSSLLRGEGVLQQTVR